MKKTYTTSRMACVAVSPQRLMAGSTTDYVFDGDSLPMGDDAPYGDAGGAAARRGFWDD